ncbi:MAG: glycosyltransferase family 4 protein [Phycisphaeraceae bacterium]|nr:glycosyltransferase family 4 protein [Phycisphaeraceae bacterium]
MNDPADNPLRILHLTLESAHGGASRYLYDLCSDMHQRGHFMAVAGQRGDWHALFAQAPFEWIDAPLGGGPVCLWRAVRQLRGYARAHDIQIVHAHYRKAMLVARRVADSLHIPMLSTLHLTNIPMGIPWRWLSDFGDATHAPSRFAGDWLIHTAGVAAEKITVIPHGIDPVKFPFSDPQDQHAARQQLALPAEATVIGYVGRFEPHKQVDWLLQIVQQLPQVHLLTMGDGPTSELFAQQVAAWNLKPRVTMLSYGDPLPVYRALDVLMLPSAYEGLSLVCNEAMSVGRAIARTQTAGWQEQVIEDETGWSSPIDCKAFIEHAARRLGDRADLRRMGEAAARHVREHLSFDRQVEQTVSFYRKLIAGKSIADKRR